ncbi:MAG: bacterioferritin comigratory protein [Chloroflexi bacterium]|nr:bacterioferritin comigratory protein [Chloroflexota bacterium]
MAALDFGSGPRPPEVGEQAPDFVVETQSGPRSVRELAAEIGLIAVASMDSYRFHPGCTGSLVASLRHDYSKIQEARAELVVLSPDSPDDHRRYGDLVYESQLPWLFASDPGSRVARLYGFLRAEEHPHGGFRERSLWVIDRTGVVVRRALPWKVSSANDESTERERADAYQLLFAWLGADPGEYQEFCQVGSSERHELDGWLAVRL